MGQTPEQDKKCDPPSCSRLETSDGGQKTKEAEGQRGSVPGGPPLCSSVQSNTAGPRFKGAPQVMDWLQFAKPLLLNSTSNQNPAGI